MDSLIFTTDAAGALDAAISELAPSGPMVIVTDSNVRKYVLPLLQARSNAAASMQVITIGAGEKYKTVATLTDVWTRMSELGVTRHSVAVCVGGGVVTDLGGFAAATFKRGIPCVNIPTTLLADVDASVGGKTGIDLGGLKNEVGAFSVPATVIVSPEWLVTLPEREWLSGYGEMIKHALIAGEERLVSLPSVVGLQNMSPEKQLEEIRRSVEVKRKVVEEDPREQGLRAVLNLGHTVGHALESLNIEADRDITHGGAVAYGTVAALVLSRMLRGLEPGALYHVASLVRDAYGPVPVDCEEYERLYDLMIHDKKNTGDGSVRFVLLDAPGQPVLKIPVDRKDIEAAIDITRDLVG